ncbi:phosphoribosylglycinamide formyltransferase [Burkholderia thailandensis]|uniref:Phosphoribosylglycinamide formyltransferase 2 n=1 Tax=Burkholderia humptydooensis MSMB43 TaxID=441157 RepID=A0ABN0GDM0_9BURK|nr:phosphoribosylglycinamide formyltransferase [Burkholderia humptydooensis]ATF34460.1 phosphoribosylglycinamide formyltransferase [Burkholderia thailandensis]EIP90407.1 phosphoribosylglycinamide formyltransferase 2 [Burkholderia humptydooensis MSMB43]KST75033.1 phosphoribosylglycinamide formyltransferase [Burkholderia humptydooensis]
MSSDASGQSPHAFVHAFCGDDAMRFLRDSAAMRGVATDWRPIGG